MEKANWPFTKHAFTLPDPPGVKPQPDHEELQELLKFTAAERFKPMLSGQGRTEEKKKRGRRRMMLLGWIFGHRGERLWTCEPA